MPCEILLVANDETNSSSVCSLAGIGDLCVLVQKLANFCHPVEYVALVVGANPRVRYRCAFWWSWCMIPSWANGLSCTRPVEGIVLCDYAHLIIYTRYGDSNALL